MANQEPGPRSFGPDYIPPAERIRRAREQEHAHDQAHGHLRPPPTTPSAPPWTPSSGALVLGLIAAASLVTLVVFILVGGPETLQDMDDCQKIQDAFEFHIAAPGKRGPTTTQNAVYRARENADAYRGLAEDFESLTLDDPELDDIRARFAETIRATEETLGQYSCQIRGDYEECGYWDPAAAQRFDTDVSQLLSDYNAVCKRYNADWYVGVSEPIAGESRLDRYKREHRPKGP